MFDGFLILIAVMASSFLALEWLVPVKAERSRERR